MSEMQQPVGGIPEWTLGWRLKRALDHPEVPVSVAEMAEYLGYSRSQISHYMNDHGAPPRPSVIAQWALKCGVPYEWLKDGTVGPDHGPDQGVAGARWSLHLVEAA